MTTPDQIDVTGLVVNRRTGEPFDVYVGRPSEWGNPFSHLPGKGDYQVESRDQAVDAFHHLLWRRIEDEGMPLVRRLAELEGKRLACWCAPERCHAEVLARAAVWAAEVVREGG